MDWPRLLAYITGTVDHELLLRNEYLVAENRILKAQIKGRLHLFDAKRPTLRQLDHPNALYKPTKSKDVVRKCSDDTDNIMGQQYELAAIEAPHAGTRTGL